MDKNIKQDSEVVVATRRNLEIVERFIDAGKDVINEMFLTGSMAWGAYQAVSLTSDIDIIIVVKKMDKIGDIIYRYIDNGLVEGGEKIKFETFVNLYNGGKVDEYSIVTKCDDVKIGIDFMPIKVVESICTLGQLQSFKNQDDYGTLEIRTIREFSPKIPKVSGYTLDDMKGKRSVIFHPPYEEVINDKGNLVGHIWSSLVDGHTKEDKNNSYFLGVKAFYFAINPIILIDKKKHLYSLTNLIRSNISKRLLGKEPLYITRQERMSGDMLKQVKSSFK